MTVPKATMANMITADTATRPQDRLPRVGSMGGAGFTVFLLFFFFFFPFSSPFPGRPCCIGASFGANHSLKSPEETGQVEGSAGREEESHHRDRPGRSPRSVESDGKKEQVQQVDAAANHPEEKRKGDKTLPPPCSRGTGLFPLPASTPKSTSGWNFPRCHRRFAPGRTV